MSKQWDEDLLKYVWVDDNIKRGHKEWNEDILKWVWVEDE